MWALSSPTRSCQCPLHCKGGILTTGLAGKSLKQVSNVPKCFSKKNKNIPVLIFIHTENRWVFLRANVQNCPKFTIFPVTPSAQLWVLIIAKRTVRLCAWSQALVSHWRLDKSIFLTMARVVQPNLSTWELSSLTSHWSSCTETLTIFQTSHTLFVPLPELFYCQNALHILSPAPYRFFLSSPLFFSLWFQSDFRADSLIL